jgi:hypothetical protein
VGGESSKITVPTVISLSSSAPTVERKRSVGFQDVRVRNYDQVLTLNPAVTSGPALGLGWDYSDEEENYTLDEFERSRERSRRDSRSLILSRHERETLLLTLGYSQKELADAIRKTIRLKNQRKQTIANLNVSPVEEFLEKATRRVKRVLRLPVVRNSKGKFSHECHPQQRQEGEKEVSLDDRRAPIRIHIIPSMEAA